jgi:betaine-homocysteine S-methyltransferase
VGVEAGVEFIIGETFSWAQEALLATEVIRQTGLPAIRGLRTMLPFLTPIRAAVSGHVAALPVPYRTHDAEPSFQSLSDPGCDCIPRGRPFPTALDPSPAIATSLVSSRERRMRSASATWGCAAGPGPHHIRLVAEALGRTPPASRYSPDMSRHAFLGTTPGLKQRNLDYATKL